MTVDPERGDASRRKRKTNLSAITLTNKGESTIGETVHGASYNHDSGALTRMILLSMKWVYAVPIFYLETRSVFIFRKFLKEIDERVFTL